MDPYSKSQPAKWSPYSDIENIIIEEAFMADQTHAMLDGYYIDFTHKIQVSNIDDVNQRPVKRFEPNKNDYHVREERFTDTPINPKRPFAGLYGWISPFIRAAAKHLNITKDQLPSKDKTTVSMIVKKAALGIIEEGRTIGKPVQADKLAKILMEKKDSGMEEVWKCCAHLYSLESFLYKKLNETMRLIGSEEHEQIWRNKVPTLGPFCLLLWDNPFNNKTIERGTILYRGATLSEEQISSFKDDCSKEDKPSRSFQSFTSCSRNRDRAEPFGNTLFIMKVKHAFSVDLKPFSEYPDEEEELLSPAVGFTVDRVEFDQNKNKYEIYLNLVQQYRQTNRNHISDLDRYYDDRVLVGGSVIARRANGFLMDFDADYAACVDAVGDRVATAAYKSKDNYRDNYNSSAANSVLVSGVVNNGRLASSDLLAHLGARDGFGDDW